MDTTQCLRAEEVARELGIARSKAYSMMASGEIPTIQIGRLVRVRRSDLLQWIETRRTNRKPKKRKVRQGTAASRT